MANVVILGGGFGGLAAAHELRSLLGDEHEITLVARAERFFMGFAKLWDLAGIRPLDEGSVPLTRLGDRGVRFVRAEVEAVDPERREVRTSAGELAADGLIVALGSVPNPAHRRFLDGPNAHDLYDAAALPAMHEALDTVDAGRVLVSILGGPFQCPPAPYEAALIVDGHLRARGVRDDVTVTIATPQPITLPAAGPDASRFVAAHLDERGVELRPEHTVAEVDHGRRMVRFADGGELDFSVLLGVPASAPPPVLAASPLAGGSGWVEVDRHTLRTAFERVYAVGDCTVVPTPGGQLPKAGVFAAAEAVVAARNLVADLLGGDEERFDGHGFCFLELPDRKVAMVEGDFYADPRPDVTISDADEVRFERKQAFERERLEAWLG